MLIFNLIARGFAFVMYDDQNQSGKIVGQLRNFDHYMIDGGDFIIINIDPTLTLDDKEYIKKRCERFVTTLYFYSGDGIIYLS